MNLNKEVQLTINALLIIGLSACSMPNSNVKEGQGVYNPTIIEASKNDNTSINQSINTNSEINSFTQKQSVQASFLLTQKDDSGVSNTILPQEIEKIYINDQAYDTSVIKTPNTKTGLSVKSIGDEILITFKNGKFFIENKADNNVLEITFKLKKSETPIIIPSINNNVKAKGEIRLEAYKDGSGEITGFSGGQSINGVLDGNKTVFKYDKKENIITILDPNGDKSSYEVDNKQFKIKPESKKQEKIINIKDEIKNISEKVDKVNVLIPFLGEWTGNYKDFKLNMKIKSKNSYFLVMSSSFEDLKTGYKKEDSEATLKFKETSQKNKIEILPTYFESTVDITNTSSFNMGQSNINTIIPNTPRYNMIQPKVELILKNDNLLSLSVTNALLSQVDKELINNLNKYDNNLKINIDELNKTSNVLIDLERVN